MDVEINYVNLTFLCRHYVFTQTALFNPLLQYIKASETCTVDKESYHKGKNRGM